MRLSYSHFEMRQEISIDSIHLVDTLPKVFENEQIPDSQVWRHDILFTRGKHYTVEAASGTGKSSLCAFIYGSRRDYLGRILFNDTDIRTLSPSQWQQIRRNQLAYLPQELDLFSELTALDNIRLKNDLTGHVGEDQIHEWLRELGIDSRTHYPVGRMSVGQQQRVAIIRSICQPFSFLIIDEPVSHLDASNNAIAAQIIMHEAERQGASVIATSVGNRIGIPVDTLLKL